MRMMIKITLSSLSTKNLSDQIFDFEFKFIGDLLKLRVKIMN